MSGDAEAVYLSSPLPWAAPKQCKPRSLKPVGLYAHQLSWGQISYLTCPEEMPETIQANRKILWQVSMHLNREETFLQP